MKEKNLDFFGAVGKALLNQVSSIGESNRKQRRRNNKKNKNKPTNIPPSQKGTPVKTNKVSRTKKKLSEIDKLPIINEILS